MRDARESGREGAGTLTCARNLDVATIHGRNTCVRKNRTNPMSEAILAIANMTGATETT